MKNCILAVGTGLGYYFDRLPVAWIGRNFMTAFWAPFDLTLTEVEDLCCGFVSHSENELDEQS